MSWGQEGESPVQCVSQRWSSRGEEGREGLGREIDPVLSLLLSPLSLLKEEPIEDLSAPRRVWESQVSSTVMMRVSSRGRSVSRRSSSQEEEEEGHPAHGTRHHFSQNNREREREREREECLFFMSILYTVNNF